MAPKSNRASDERSVRFVKQFRHYRSGKIIRAADYGLKSFPIGTRRK